MHSDLADSAQGNRESAPIRVLVCDDQTVVRAGYMTILAAQPDMTVVGEAGNGAVAVAEAQRLLPDVVVMDVRMPVLDGIEATRRLAGPLAPVLANTGPVKVLVVTTFNLDEYVYQALRAGASGFLLKDAPPAELTGAVRTVAAGESLLAPAVTRRLIGRYAARIRPADPGAPRARGADADRRGDVQRGNRRDHGRQRGNGEDVRVAHPR